MDNIIEIQEQTKRSTEMLNLLPKIIEIQEQTKRNTEMLHIINKKLLSLQPSDYYMNIKDVARYAKLSESTIRRYLHEIKHHQRDRVILFKKSAIDKWIASFEK